jgi:hypothetical protein
MKQKIHQEMSRSVPINAACSRRWLVFTAMVLAMGLIGVTIDEASAHEKPDRTVLPVQEPEPPTYTELDARNATPPPRFEVKAPSGAPNVVIVLIDDIGFGGPSALGGPLQTPTMDHLAKNGLLFNNFHTTALCSPTRMALKTGRNHHTCNTGSIMETATGFPGNTGALPNRVAPLAEMLRLNGYSTGAFGKWHETAAWETSLSGPFDRWPTHQGFDKFYGFIGGETDQWYPLIYDATNHSSSTSQQAPCTRHIMCRENGLTNTKGNLTMAGTRFASRRSAVKKRWGSFRRLQSCPRSPKTSRTGTR